MGHNIDFDYRMLRQSFKRLGFDFKINTLDTIPLAKKLIPHEKSYSLGNYVNLSEFLWLDEHRASGDARATLELFKLLKPKTTATKLFSNIMKKATQKNLISIK